jgi:hypothetical protein
MLSEEEVKKNQKGVEYPFRQFFIKHSTLWLLRNGKRDTVKCLNQSLQFPIA